MYIRIYICVYMHVLTYIYTFMHVHCDQRTCLEKPSRIFVVRICGCMHVQTYIYICEHMYVLTYMYTCMHVSLRGEYLYLPSETVTYYSRAFHNRRSAAFDHSICTVIELGHAWHIPLRYIHTCVCVYIYIYIYVYTLTTPYALS